jgi:hypothetical protein
LEQEIKWSRAGMNLILHRSDIALFRQGLNEDITALRNATGDKAIAQSPKDIII